MPVFLAALVVLVFAFGAAAYLARARRIVVSRDTKRIDDALAITGLDVAGDVLRSYVLRGRARGIDLVVDNGSSQRRPGPGDESFSVCSVRFAAGMQDLIVCRVSEIDAVMGALPAAPRVRTGHERFDSMYAVFVSGGSSAEYRGPAPIELGGFAVPKILGRFLDLDLCWMRAQGGNIEIAFTTLDAEDVTRAVDVAASVALTARGEPPLDVAGGPREIRVPSRLPGHPMIAWGSATLAMFCGIPVAFLPPLRDLNAESVCGAGATIRSVGCGNGGCLECSNAPDSWLIGHYASVLLFVFALTAAAIMANMIVRHLGRARTFEG